VHASSTPGFFPNTYGMSMGLVDVTPNVGMPTETVPIQATTNALETNVDLAAFWFTAAEGEGYGIIATPPNGSTLLTEVQVFCVGIMDPWFGAFCSPGETQLIQVHTATAANPGEALDSGFFTAGYDGEFLVVIRDASGTATGTETYGISLGKPVCDLDSTRCTGNAMETCNGYGWTETEVCANECAMIGEAGACVKSITSLPYTDTAARPADYAFDYYKMELAADTTVDIEMIMGNCIDDDTMLVLLDDTGAEIVSNDDGADYCARIIGEAITGGTTYYIGAYVYTWSPSNDYTLTVTAQ
jgi:hypothetical protein